MGRVLAAAWLAALAAGAVPSQGDTSPTAQTARPAAAASTLGGIRAPLGLRAAAHKGAVASAYPLASQAGREMLAKGGNAFDAAIAVSAALAVVEPTSSGLGGGGFYLLHRSADGADVMLDAREKAPAAAGRDMYL